MAKGRLESSAPSFGRPPEGFRLNNPMLQPSRGPGRDSKGAPPPPAPKPQEGVDASATPAAPPADAGFGGMGIMLPMLIGIFVLFFFMNRSDKKRRQKVEDELKKGDMVLTRAGFIGKIVQVGEKRCRIELAPGVNVWMIKAAIEGPADDDKPDAKDAKDKDKDKDKDAADDKDKGGKKKKK